MTGRKHRDLEKILVAVIAGAVSRKVLCAIRAIVEFIFHAQGLLLYQDQLNAITEVLQEFHNNKAVLIEHGELRGKNGPIHHFKIPKVEGMGRVPFNAQMMGAVLW